MSNDNLLPILVILGFGGIAIYLLTRKTVPPVVAPVDKGLGQCGASYAGAGLSIPCDTAVKGIKALAGYIGHTTAARTVAHEASIAASGIEPWEYVVSPVAISHAAYNELKRLNPFG